MKFKIEILPGDWHVPYVKKFWWWEQIAGGHAKHEDAVMEIGKYALGMRLSNCR